MIKIIDIETAGTATWVSVAAHDEDEAYAAAQEALGTESVPSMSWISEGGFWLAEFETADL